MMMMVVGQQQQQEESTHRHDQQQQQENPYRPIQQWFDAGNHLELTYDMKDQQKTQALYQVDGLYALVKKTYKGVNEKEAALLMEFVLHGLSSYSLISKKTLEGGIAFKDLMGSMLNFGKTGQEEFGYEEDL